MKIVFEFHFIKKAVYGKKIFEILPFRLLRLMDRIGIKRYCKKSLVVMIMDYLDVSYE